jgi:hypothetical protein
MKRTNLFSLAPSREQHRILQELAVNCAKLWNEVNYLHRQQYSDYLKLDWNPQAYKKYVPLVGSATKRFPTAETGLRKHSHSAGDGTETSPALC